LLVDVMWFHTGCIDVKVVRVTLQCVCPVAIVMRGIHVMLYPMLNGLYIHISTFRSTCAVPNVSVLCIIITIIILGISSMQGIYTYIPETNHVPKEHCVATILM
jgi:hypothetical protein